MQLITLKQITEDLSCPVCGDSKLRAVMDEGGDKRELQCESCVVYECEHGGRFLHTLVRDWTNYQ